VALVFGKLYLFIKAVCQAVDPYPDKALFTEIFEQFPVFTFFAVNERGQQNDLGSLRLAHEGVDHILNRL
jgi:hypothetical protein